MTRYLLPDFNLVGFGASCGFLVIMFVGFDCCGFELVFVWFLSCSLLICFDCFVVRWVCRLWVFIVFWFFVVRWLVDWLFDLVV